MKKLLFIYNAHSGKTQIKAKLADIIDIFIKEGYYVEAYQTQSVGDAKRQIAGRGSHYDRIVVAGGDGTLNEAIAGMMRLQSKIALGYIPTGSTNDFAASIRLPKDLVHVAKIAVNGTPAYVDVGSFNRDNFIYVAAFGAFTDVSYSTPQDLKNVLGHSAYLIEGLKQFGHIMDSRHFEIERENGLKEEGDYIYGMITNSISVGGFKRLTGNNIVLDDGLFEVTLIRKPNNPLELQDIISSLLVQKKSRMISTFKTSKLKLVSDENVKWVLDGEYKGSPKKVVIRNHPCAVKIMTGFPMGKKDKMVHTIKHTLGIDE